MGAYFLGFYLFEEVKSDGISLKNLKKARKGLFCLGEKIPEHTPGYFKSKRAIARKADWITIARYRP
jgi:hypothetical protein